jgi:hypothetical protein
MLLLRLSRWLIPRVFISYSHKDASVANACVNQIRAEGFRCWQDTSALRVIDDFDDKIKLAIRRSLAVVLFASRHSIRSKWVLEEAEYSLAHQRRVIVVKVDESDLPPELAALSRLQWAKVQDFTPVLGALRTLGLAFLAKRMAAALLVGIALVGGWLLTRATTDLHPGSQNVEVVVWSDLLPATVFCDDHPMGTLTPDYPRKTIDVAGKSHIFEMRHGQKAARAELSKQEGTTNVLLYFSAAEFK